MWNPARSMSIILTAAESGHGELPSEDDLRKRLSALEDQVALRGWSMQDRGEYFALCRAIERVSAERRA
ncbi:MAG: hypothetical protein ACR652_01310 [Methylocystis sp.]|uniref:hypothetical protein n=1 Tax=Methylocystis sp. TaxID=1911079 RepID=UPI003DA24FAC